MIPTDLIKEVAVQFPDRPVETLTLDRANASPEQKARVIEFCRRRKAEGAVALGKLMRRQSPPNQ